MDGERVLSVSTGLEYPIILAKKISLERI